MTRARVPGRLIAAGGGGLLLVVVLVGVLAPSPASAGILGTPIPNPADAVKDLIGVPGDVASKLGATVLQDALEWLLGGLKATITLEFVRFLVHVELAVGESLAKLTGPMIVIGGWFLIVGLLTSIGDGYREVIAGTDTAPRVIGGVIFRVIGLAILLGSWFWIVPLAVDVANGLSGYVLSDDAVGSALRRTFAGEKLLHVGFPLLGLLTGVMLAFAILALVVLKFIIAIAFAALYIGGPALIGFAALPRVGNLPLAIVTRGLLTLTVIPLLWTVVFAAWAGVNAGMFDAASGGGSAVGALMGPGLFLAGLVVMLGVTKKVLAMATFGVALSVPGASVARAAITTAVTRGLGSAGRTAAAAETTATTARSDERSRATTRQPAGAEHQAEPTTGRRTSAPTPPRPRRYPPLDTSPRTEHVERERTVLQRQAASAANAALGVNREGTFVSPRGVSRDAVEHVGREIRDRRAQGQVSVEEVRRAGDVLTAADRSAFTAAAEVSQREVPTRAHRHFERTASVQIAGAPALDASERGAAITIASAHPEVVQRAFASDHRAWRHGEHDSPRAGDYDDDLFDPNGGLERFRAKYQPKREAGERSQPDEGSSS